MNSQKEKEFDTLVLGSCKSSPFLLLGFLHRLYVDNFFENINIYSSSGSGAVISLLMISGYSPKQIIEECIDNPMMKNCLSNIYSDDVQNMTMTMRNILKSFLVEKFTVSPTMKQLHLMTGKEFYFTIFDKGENIISHDSDYSVVDVVLECLNIPVNVMLKSECLLDFIDSSFVNPIPIPPTSSTSNIFPVIVVNNIQPGTKMEHIISYLMNNVSNVNSLNLVGDQDDKIHKQLFDGMMNAERILQHLCDISDN